MKNLLARLLYSAFGATLLLGFVGCETTGLGKKSSFDYDPPILNQVKNPKNLKLKLSTGAQRLYLVEGNTLILATPVTVGTVKTPTPHGDFTIYSKTEKRRRFSNPGAGYPMTYWMEFKPAYGLHWGFLKSHPSTHGCVRMPIDAARKVFNLIPVGTPINIARSQPLDETVGKNLPVLCDSHLANPPMSYMNSPQVFEDARRGTVWKYD